MAQIYIKDESSQEQLIKDLHINNGRIITPEMLKGTSKEGEFGYEEEQEELNLEEIDINSAPGMMLSSEVVNAISQYLEATVQSVIAGSAQNLISKLGINQDTLAITEQILNIIDSAIFKINSILKFIPTNINIVPSTAMFTSVLVTSLKDLFMAAWLNIQQQYYITINEALTNLPTPQEALKDGIEALCNMGEALIDQLCIKYTGKTLAELLYLCRTIIAKYKDYKEKRRMMRNGTTVKNNIHIEVNVEQVKEDLMNELATCSDMIYNSFMILQIKDSFQEIVHLINQFNNIDLSVLTDGINSFQDFMDLLDELGVNDKSSVLTLEEAIKSGINSIQNSFNSLTKQLAAQAMASGASMLDSVIKNTNIDTSIQLVQNYIFDFDLDTRTITITFKNEPSVKSIRKNLNSALSKAKDENKKTIFAQNEIKQIFDAIDTGMFEYKDQELTVLNYNIKIKFDIDGYNKEKVTLSKNPYEWMSQQLDQYQVIQQYQERIEQLQQQKEADKQNVINQFELGVVTEEYTKDPTASAKRPTIQLVHELYCILQEIFPLLKIVATLISNYKINKAKVQNNAQGNLFGMIRFIAKTKNLLQKLDKSDKNFYTVRTLKLYDYINNHIKKQENETPQLELSQDETKTLYNYLKQNNLNTESINTDLDTLLYIDLESISDQQTELNENYNTLSQYFGEDASLFLKYPETKYDDGTILGIDKIEETDDTIYFSDSSLPIINSQIMRCYAKNLDVSV